MQFLEFNTETLPKIRIPGIPAIHMNFKTGLININKEAAEKMGLEDGDQVVFLQQKDELENWFIEKVKSKGFIVRRASPPSLSTSINNATIVRKIAESVEYTERSGRVLLAGQPTKIDKRILWGIITSTLKTNGIPHKEKRSKTA